MAPSAIPTFASGPDSPWKIVRGHLWRALLWFLVAILAGVAAAVAYGVVAGVLGTRSRLGAATSDTVSTFLVTLVLAVVMIKAAWSTARRHGEANPRAWLGDRPVQRPIVVGTIIGLDVAYVIWTTRALTRGQPLAPPSIPTWWSYALMIALAVVIGPLWEEVFFRGWLWAALKRELGVRATAGITSLLWLACHLLAGWEATLLLLPLAVALPATRQLGHSVRASLMLHAINNGASLLAARLLLS